jgi:hypothetical protein
VISFAEFAAQDAIQGRYNPVFEHGMHSLVNDLEQIVSVLRAAGIAFEVIGGVAVNAHLLPDHGSRAFVTRDIDLLVRRDDLTAIASAAEAAGYTARKILGGHMLIRPGQQPQEAIHLVFVGEKSRSTYPLPHPELEPEERVLFGLRVPVVPLAHLVRMKLNSFRPKDLVHLQILDEAGLIDARLESTLPETLRERLLDARRQFAEGEPDVE